MTTTVNGEAYVPRAGETVLDLVAAHTGRPLDPDGRPVDGGRLGIAVAVDRTVVPRSSWARTPVTDGQQIDLVTAVQGG
ncbi:sulfur carrier protein ThiS [Raineyella sp. W15-4]|uniref:sulfur carrier protein ThiS n=1 Tax=Raineyella sp. W15-4 TaxID=3081651 RepID=UPI002955B2E4|nr:sulfur carrier protein ThiS [Raineyella sp. W15-4]WOQ16025.1 sulfur carrier protein ThiS [Raineyella sp. W15-4]